MSTLSELGAAAKSIREAAHDLKKVTGSVKTDLLPVLVQLSQSLATVAQAGAQAVPKLEAQATGALEAATGALARIEEKANAVLGHVGEAVEKLTAIAVQLRDGQDVEGEVKLDSGAVIGGKVHLVKEQEQ